VSYTNASTGPREFETRTPFPISIALSLSFLQDKARSYDEPFTVQLEKFDDTTATISNEGNP